jgi:O-succinylbenzoic acid--CoA ligase
MFKVTFLDYSEDFQQEVNQLVLSFKKEVDLLVYSSGSTGEPSEITLSFETIKNSAKLTNDFFYLRKNSKALLCLSPKVIAGKMMIARAYFGDYEIACQMPSSRPLESIDSQYDFMAMVPLQLQTSIESNDELTLVKNYLIGGGPISVNLEEKLQSIELSVYHSYGMTETASHVALRKAGYKGEKEFVAMPGIHFTLNNHALVIHAPHLNSFPLVTNDCVELISERSFVWKGRLDFVINSGGMKLHPENLELKWADFLNTPFFLSGENDEKLGQKLVLYLENDPASFVHLDIARLAFSKYEWPKHFYLVSKFDYTESGKINRLTTIKKKKIELEDLL